MKKYLLYVFFAFVLVSCVQEWAPEVPQAEDGLVERTWTVSMSDGTRATLDETLRPVWEVGEELSVYDHVANVGRIFRVESVNGRSATIKGQISAGGDTPFDAVYPAASAGEWSPDGTNTLKLPELQYIPSGRVVCPDVLVSTAHSDVPDGVISFHNISSLLKVKVGREGIADISVSLVGSSDDDIRSYKAEAGSGTFATGTYFIAVDPGTYDGGLKVVCSDGFGMEYHKSSSSPLEAGIGGMLNLGVVSDGTPWRYYNVTAEKTYGSQQVLLDETGLLDNLDSFTKLMVQVLLSMKFSDRNRPATAISYTYRSADPQGKPVELSALIYIPKAALDGTELSGICLANHGTIASNAECPTMKGQFEGAFAWKNFAILMPDYYGFGVSADRPQAYLDAETTARGNIDAYLAAVQLLKDLDVTIPSDLYSFGYSQGGFNSMANLKYVSQHPELDISFRKVMCGGSPFDVELTWDAYTKGLFRNAIAFVPMTVVSINESQQLGLPYSSLFKGDLLQNWQEWILSKDYTISQINRKIGTDGLSGILNDDFMAGTGSAYDSIMAVCRRYSLTSGWIPPSGTDIILYHSKGDDTVPFDNLAAMKEFLDDVAPDSYTLRYGDDGGHVAAVVSYVMDIIDEW